MTDLTKIRKIQLFPMNLAKAFYVFGEQSFTRKQLDAILKPFLLGLVPWKLELAISRFLTIGWENENGLIEKVGEKPATYRFTEKAARFVDEHSLSALTRTDISKVANSL